jgi:CheY-like chemotaxis protein
VTLAIDGKDAMEILEKSVRKFDLIVSDIEMPRMNGFELAQAVRSNSHFSAIPLLAISSRADKIYSDRGLKSGFDIYLEKLKPALLLDAVSKLMKSQRRAS